MPTIRLAGLLLLFAYLGYLLFFITTEYMENFQRINPPFAIWIIDTINLFIHEAGHLFLKPFGMFMHILGGTLFQLLLPFALLFVVWQQNPDHAVFPGFWLGESMVNVSVYINDAPFRKIKLLSGGLIHDWGYLLAGRTEMGPPIATVVFWLGILTCGASLAAGLFWAVRTFREDRGAASTPGSWRST